MSKRLQNPLVGAAALLIATACGGQRISTPGSPANPVVDRGQAPGSWHQVFDAGRGWHDIDTLSVARTASGTFTVRHRIRIGRPIETPVGGTFDQMESVEEFDCPRGLARHVGPSIQSLRGSRVSEIETSGRWERSTGPAGEVRRSICAYVLPRLVTRPSA